MKLSLPAPGDFLRYPSLAGALIVGLLPIVGVLLWGWKATPLILLFWLENLVIGAFALLRMIASAIQFGATGIGLIAFLGPFFLIHYGLFCAGHGTFVMLLTSNALKGGVASEVAVMDLQAMVKAALGAAPGIGLVLGVIIAWKAILFGVQFMWRGDFRKTNPAEEMFRPYGRIVTLHIAIFAGAFGLLALGEPAWGMLALIGLKTVYDVVTANADAKAQTAARSAKIDQAMQALRARLERGTDKP